MLEVRNKNKNISLGGYTILELLVVISIMTFILSSIISVTTVARRNARDAKRKSDAHQLEIALESYYSDNAQFPAAQSVTSGQICDGTSQIMWNSTTLVNALVPRYLIKMPRDPLSPTNFYPIFPYDYQYACLTGNNPSEYGILITFGNDINKPTCKIVYPLSSSLYNGFPTCDK